MRGHAEACGGMRVVSDFRAVTACTRPPCTLRYEPAIFFHSEEQRVAALASRQQLQAKLGNPVAARVRPADEFWPAADEHQVGLRR